MTQLSMLHKHSQGIVAVNKPLDTDIVEITPIEDLNMIDGDITDNLEKKEKKGKDYYGGSFESSVDMSITIKARWLPLGGSNRLTPPDVRRGEEVMIYRFGDSEQFYWTTLEYARKLRKLETVVLGISATKDEGAEGTPENMYYIEFSTHKKLIHMHTSKANDEPFMYDIQLNTEEGYLLITDDIGNLINLDSKNVRIELTNSDKTTLQLDKKNMYGYAPDNITFKSGKSFNIETDKINTKASVTTNNVPTTRFTGSVGTKGNLSVNGRAWVSGLGSNSGLIAPGYGLGSDFSSV